LKLKQYENMVILCLCYHVERCLYSQFTAIPSLNWKPRKYEALSPLSAAIQAQKVWSMEPNCSSHTSPPMRIQHRLVNGQNKISDIQFSKKVVYFSNQKIAKTSDMTFWLVWIWFFFICTLIKKYLTIYLYFNIFNIINFSYFEKNYLQELRR